MNQYEAQPLDLMQFINTKYHEPFIHEWISFEGQLDPVRLKQSIHTLLDVFPILKCRYDSEKNLYVEREELTEVSLLRVSEEDNRTGFLTESLDMNEKLIQFTISKNNLYLTVSHLVCDGSGFKQLLYLFCEIYNDSFDGESGHLMNRDFSVLTSALKKQTGRTVKMLMAMMGNYKNKQIYEKNQTEIPYVIEKDIEKDTMKKAYTMAKACGATLNDVFLTAYARTLVKKLELDRVNIPCTVDLRKYAAGETGIANLTGTYNLNIKIKEGEAFRETLSKVTACMQKQKKTQNDIAGPMLLVSKYEKTSLADFLKLYGGMDTSAFTDYTNLGILDNKKLAFRGADIIKAVGFSGMSKAPYFQAAVSSFKGITTITSLFQCAESEKQKAETILDTMAAEIKMYANT